MNSVDTGHCSVNGIRPEGLAGIVELTRAGDREGAFHAGDYTGFVSASTGPAGQMMT
jgi:hypothetical protein